MNVDGKSNKSQEEQEESSSSSIHDQVVEEVLDSFREKWRKELETSKKVQGPTIRNTKVTKENEDLENKAKALFLHGIEMERTGNVYEAIQFYRRAVQLVPDIEFRLHAISKSLTKSRQGSEEDIRDIVEKLYDPDEDEDSLEDHSTDDDNDYIKAGELLSYIQRKYNNHSCIVEPESEQKTTHITALPMEILLYILRWVVSSDLDVHSLEMCSLVCRRLYLCCRDTEIWRLICARTWGINVGTSPIGYSSWRQMFTHRSRLHFNGCYISKTTYIRHGENSFQDQFYRAWHIVTYYRYLRFFPEGLVLMLTTAEEPALCVGQLRYRIAKSPAVLSGHYILKDDKVTLVVHREELPKSTTVYKRSRKRDGMQDNAQQTFHLAMQIQSYKGQKHIQLVWTGYSVYTRNRNGTESSCTFDLVGNRFPPLWFSRVKSYTADSYGPV